MLYGVVIWGNASLFLLCFYIDHSNRIVLDKQVTSDRKKHISMAFRLCVLGCALWELSAYITLPFVGLIHPRWGFVYPVEGNTCSSRPGMSMWCLGTQLESLLVVQVATSTFSEAGSRWGEVSLQRRWVTCDDTWTPWNFIVNYILTSRSPMHIADTYHFYLYWALMFWDSISL